MLYEVITPEQEKPVEFSIKRQGPAEHSGCFVVGIFESRKLADGHGFGEATRRFLQEILATGDMDGKAGTTLLLRNVRASVVMPSLRASRTAFFSLFGSITITHSGKRLIVRMPFRLRYILRYSRFNADCIFLEYS